MNRFAFSSLWAASSSPLSLTSVNRISIADFQREVVPVLTDCDTVILLESSSHRGKVSEHAVFRALAQTPAKLCVISMGSAEKETTRSLQYALVVVSIPYTKPRQEVQHFDCLESLLMKIVLNAITTGAQVIKGRIFQNRMINTGPTNDKIYHRCIEMVAELTQTSKDEACDAMLRAIYEVDCLSPKVRALPISEHIKYYSPSNEADRLREQKCLPLAILLASGMKLKDAKDALQHEPVVRKIIFSILGERILAELGH